MKLKFNLLQLKISTIQPENKVSNQNKFSLCGGGGGRVLF